MASFTCKPLILLFVCLALQEGCGLPLSDKAELPAGNARHIRTKRCSCNSWEDKECIYFCHLDIIWVNTPSKLLPYGLGSPPSRRLRRSVDRCECFNPADKTCSAFCQKSSEDPKSNILGPLLKSSSTKRSKLLASFRTVVKSNTVVANKNRLRSRTTR